MPTTFEGWSAPMHLPHCLGEIACPDLTQARCGRCQWLEGTFKRTYQRDPITGRYIEVSAEFVLLG